MFLQTSHVNPSPKARFEMELCNLLPCLKHIIVLFDSFGPVFFSCWVSGNSEMTLDRLLLWRIEGWQDLQRQEADGSNGVWAGKLQKEHLLIWKLQPKGFVF